jgi:4-hydroxy-tetrahydrodipicolinate synthase
MRGDYDTAREIQRRYFPLMEINFVESNPGPVKAAMASMGLLQPVWRLPMVPPSAASMARIQQVLTNVGLLTGQGANAAD